MGGSGGEKEVRSKSSKMEGLSDSELRKWSLQYGYKDSGKREELLEQLVSFVYHLLIIIAAIMHFLVEFIIDIGLY
jgi:hypothetical protein